MKVMSKRRAHSVGSAAAAAGASRVDAGLEQRDLRMFYDVYSSVWEDTEF